ncbi:MAG: hypothetical protein O3A20_01350 [Planctomycetota bacterium]|nr:hypothetical protein [Planctomycetota bacterium]
MAHPLIVEAAETLFVPLAIKNNTEGDADARVREHFDEAAWNNPVGRVLNPASEKDLLPKLHQREDWSRAAMLELMARALGETAPPWLTLAAQEERALARGVETAIFGML